MTSFEPYTSKKNRSFTLPVLAVILLGVLLVVGLNFGTSIYYRFSGNAVHRVASRSTLYEQRALEGTSSEKELYLFIEDSRKIIDLLEETKPSHYLVPYYRGLFDFYEFLLRTNLDADNLVQMVGKGYIPLDQGIDGLEPSDEEKLLPLEKLSRNISVSIRKSLALNPDLAEQDRARVMIVYATVFDTGRTDPYLVELVNDFQGARFNSFFQPRSDWIAVALYTILGEAKNLEGIMNQLEVVGVDPAGAASLSETANLTDNPSGDERVERLKLSEVQANFILANGYYYSKDYIKALGVARSIFRGSDKDSPLAVASVVLEAEIFLAQRGPIPALRYFHRALKLAGGKDPLIEQRIEEVEQMLKGNR